MKQSVRNALIAGVLVLSSFFFYLSFYDLPYNPFGGHDSAESDVASNDAPDKSLPDVPPEVPQDKNTGIDQEPGVSGDKIIVMAKTKAEDTDWVKDNLPEYISPFHTSPLNPPHVCNKLMLFLCLVTAGSEPSITWTTRKRRVFILQLTKDAKQWHT